MNTATAASPPESWTSSSRSLDGGPGPALSRRPAPFRGNATARSAAREMIANSRPSCSWPPHSLPHRIRCRRVAAPSGQFRRSLPTTFGAEPVKPPPQPRKSQTGNNTIAPERRWSSPPELHPPQVAAPLVQRLAVQLQARRRVGLSILHQCPCGGIDSCNGMLDSALLFRDGHSEILQCDEVPWERMHGKRESHQADLTSGLEVPRRPLFP